MLKNKKYIIVLAIIFLFSLGIFPVITTAIPIIDPPPPSPPPPPSSIEESEDFSDEIHGTTGLDIDWVDEYHGHQSSYYCDHRVLDGPYGSHSKVLIVRDAQGMMNTWSVKWLDHAYDDGNIQFALWLTRGSMCTAPNYHYLQFRNTADIIAFEFRFDLRLAQAWVKGGSGWQPIVYLTNDDWYLYTISFSKSAGRFSVEIEHESTSNLKATISGITYQNSVSIEEVYIGTDYGHLHGNSRWDNFFFTSDTLEKFGVFFYSTDAGHGAGNVINAGKIRAHIAEYKNILLAKGYSEVLVYEDVGSNNELNACFNAINALEDKWDAVFFYIWTHGNYDGDDSNVKLNAYIDYSYMYFMSSSKFNNKLDGLDTNKIGFLVDASCAGGFVLDFTDDPYLAMSSSDTIHSSLIYWPSGEAFFSNSFWDQAGCRSNNAIDCWYWARFWNWIPCPMIYNGLNGYTFF